MNKRFFGDTLFPLLPLLALYIVIVVAFSTDTLMGDESRHVGFAKNITEGFYVAEDNPNFRNGPGYPLVLAPFIAIGNNLLVPKLLNAFLLFFAVVYFKKTIDLFSKNRYSLLFVYLLGLYPPVIRWLPFLYSEPLAYFLVCALIYYTFRLYQSRKMKPVQLIMAILYLGFLILVKIIYLQVILVSILLLVMLFIWKRNQKFSKALYVLLGSFVFIMPYLIYAFLITGKPLYVGSGGGEILYHRATPFENEWGNWFSSDDVLHGAEEDYEQTSVYKDLRELSNNHRDFYLTLEPLTHIQRDSAFKAAAIKNMKANPKKYVKNTVANVGRFLFHYPFSYRSQDMGAYGYMLPNIFILTLWAFSLYPFLKARKYAAFEVKVLMVFSLIYAAGIILLDGRGRNFIVMVPTLILFFSYSFTNLLKISLIKPLKNSEDFLE